MIKPDRQTMLKIAAGLVVGLLLLDRMVINPAIDYWREQSLRIAHLREQVDRGRQLTAREDHIRTRWREMVESDLPAGSSAAEDDVFRAMARWANESGIQFTNLTPQWREHEGGYQTLEVRASATGGQGNLGRLLFAMETDPLPVYLEECQITPQDAAGRQLQMNARFSFVRLNEGRPALSQR